jgi:hypothetical protein
MTDIAYQDVTTTLLKEIPELAGDYERELESWKPDEVHPHIVYGTVFAKFIERTVHQWRATNEDAYEQLLQRCFACVERVASSCDFESRCAPTPIRTFKYLPAREVG